MVVVLVCALLRKNQSLYMYGDRATSSDITCVVHCVINKPCHPSKKFISSVADLVINNLNCTEGRKADIGVTLLEAKAYDAQRIALGFVG